MSEKTYILTDSQIKQIRTDTINAIKNDLFKKLTDEQNKPYQDHSLCLGYYNAIKVCDWYLIDDKGQKYLEDK